MIYLLTLMITAATIAMEAGGEPYSGKLGVGFVITARTKKRGKSILDVIFQRDHFSCWRDDSPTTLNLDQLTEKSFAECVMAAMAALNETEPDPTGGADHYLNQEATRAGRPNHDLPNWFDEQKVTVRIGAHTFLKLL